MISLKNTPSAVRVMQRFQARLENLYEVSCGHDVDDFLITDRKTSNILDTSTNARDVSEKLLVAESDDGLEVSLFVDAQLLERLADTQDSATAGHFSSDSDRINHYLVDDYCVALEGASHFVYLLHNAQHQRPVSCLELELQAEVDKYCTIASALEGRDAQNILAVLHARMFDNPSFDPDLTREELTRYRDANDLAARFCSFLNRRYLRKHRTGAATRLLRRFYRLGEKHKLQWIQSAA